MTPEKLGKFKEDVAEIFSSDLGSVSFVGEKQGSPLEHTVRKYVLDKFIKALGWDLADSVAEEARIAGEKTLFLDYLGVHLDQKLPLFILEAKAWEKPFVTRSDADQELKAAPVVLADTLTQLKAGSVSAPLVTNEWLEWLTKLMQYVTALSGAGGDVVQKVAISSGQWLVIFTDPANAFVNAGPVNRERIITLWSEEFVENSDDIYNQLSFDRLVGKVERHLRPSELPAYISVQGLRRIFRGLGVAWQSAWAKDAYGTFPRILLYPSIILERANGDFLTVASYDYRPVEMPFDASQMESHLKLVQSASDELLYSVLKFLGREFAVSDISDFPGFPEPVLYHTEVGAAPMKTQTTFVRRSAKHAGEYLLVTGKVSHFLLSAPSIDACDAHTYGDCKAAGAAAALKFVVSSSVDPTGGVGAWSSLQWIPP